jgi:hypothetical protein
MIQGDKGVYPDWMLEQNVIDRILTDLKQKGGRLSYRFLLNPEQKETHLNRMRNILFKMSEERLIRPGIAFIQLDEEGEQALETGYERYCKAKRRVLLLRKVKTGAKILTYLFIAAVIGLTIYRAWEVY